MSQKYTAKPPTWFWVVAAIALIWNLMGVFAFIMDVTISPDTLSQLPEEQRALYENTPLWATIAYAVAVFGGALGALFLLLKNKVARPLLILSLAGVLVQMTHSIFMSNSMEVFGPGGLVMPVMIIIICIAMIWLSGVAISKNWIN